MAIALLSATGEKMELGDAALYALIGFVIVLLVLALLVGIFYLMGAIFRSKLFTKRKEDDAPAQKSVEQPSDDAQTVAAISAAIAVVLEQENGGEAPEFVIRRITRKNKK